MFYLVIFLWIVAVKRYGLEFGPDLLRCVLPKQEVFMSLDLQASHLACGVHSEITINF